MKGRKTWLLERMCMICSSQLEEKLLLQYSLCTQVKRRDAVLQSSPQETKFWEGLEIELSKTRTEIERDECPGVWERYGKREEEFKRVKSEVLDIAQELDPTFDRDDHYLHEVEE